MYLKQSEEQTYLVAEKAPALLLESCFFTRVTPTQGRISPGVLTTVKKKKKAVSELRSLAVWEPHQLRKKKQSRPLVEENESLRI